MRAELPWNVAGIPPEAREAARAAARREGLSVGEWLTRRIISELGEGAAAFPVSTAEQGPDSVSSANRRDTVAMLARLAEAEAEASHTYRRIEEQLRNVGSGLDNAERSQSESHRAMSRAASEISIASQEQSQAFDELGRHMMGLDERLEKLERAALQDGLKEAVKGLHQGLTRLADQFGQATSRSGGQVASLARNLEQLALRLVQARTDAEAAALTLEAHLAQLEETHQFTNGTIEQILARLDAQGEVHDQHLLEVRRHNAVHQSLMSGIEDRLASLEEPDGAMEMRLQAIERELETIGQELEEPDPHADLADTLNQIALRLDMAEQSHSDALAELKAELHTCPAHIPEPAPEQEGHIAEAVALEPLVLVHEESPVDLGPPAQDAPMPILEALPDNSAPHAFANHMPQDFADVLARPIPADEGATEISAKDSSAEEIRASEQDFLETVRRSARETAQADAERGLMGWRRSTTTEKKRPIALAILAAIFFLLLASAAALLLNQRFRPASNPPKPLPRHVAMANHGAVTVTPRLQVAQPQMPVSVPTSTASLEQSPETHPSMTAVPAAPTVNRVLAAAIGGNDAAETIMGLKNLDGGDSVAAFQWLEKAALQGQPVAEYRLATMYERGQGVTANPGAALKWYLAAANQGNRKAMHNLAVAYAEGTTGKKDMVEAARWFAQAAALGLSDSQFNLAVLYERGDGVPASLTDAYKWYFIAAANGDAESLARLSVLKTQLSDAERGAAERAATSFRPQPLNRLANIPPDATDIAS